jgi:LysR family transcriptional regulator, glycine cleavage system transcriptional activator
VRKRLPPLESLRVLSTCIRHGNFMLAAAELGITASAVSQRIRALEAEMGVRLFERHGPKVMATDRARALGQRLEQALALLRTAVDDCRRIRYPLRVTCAPTFAARWLMPRLATYHGLPGADAIVLDTRQELLPSGAFDVAIRSGRGPWPGVEATRLMPERRTPLLSPKLLSKRFTPEKLLETPLIPDPGWADWFKLVGLKNVKPRSTSTRFPDYEMEAQAAVRGVGAALLCPVLFADLIAQRALLSPFRQMLDSGVAYWLLCEAELSQRHFVSWVRSQFEQKTS